MVKIMTCFVTSLIAISLSLSGCGGAKDVSTAVTEETAQTGEAEMNEYTLTTEEQDLLIKAFGNEENIRSGKLYDYQKDALEQLRAGMQYLEAKYPGEQLTVTYFSNATKLTQQAFCNFEDPSGQVYDLAITYENGQYVCRDTYYGELIRGSYDAELGGYLQGSGISAKLYTSFSTPAGIEVKSGTTVSSLNAIEPKIARCTHIFVDESYKGTGVDTQIRSILEDKGAYGSYILYFAPDCAAKSADELESMRTQFESVSFNCFNV